MLGSSLQRTEFRLNPRLGAVNAALATDMRKTRKLLELGSASSWNNAQIFDERVNVDSFCHEQGYVSRGDALHQSLCTAQRHHPVLPETVVFLTTQTV